ncbi:MAG: TonB-dependent receptor plug, partial [Gemmatimonadetes bacterium]|nr:TonB-dependent receptor plug [Gemmatimonadota bacterium]
AAARGTAWVTGRVVTRTGAPVANARIGLVGASAATLTRANGEFVLDSVPAGTQALVVRQIGYRPTETPVELSSRTPTRVTVRLGDFVPELSPVEVVSRRDEGLQRVGFLERKRTAATGHFIDSEQIERRQALQFTDLMRTVPGVRVEQSKGQSLLVATRGQSGGGCVTIYVDGAQWQQITPGDLDSYVRPSEIAAIEVYSGQQVPPQFTTLGQSCSAVVVWTKTRVLQRGR